MKKIGIIAAVDHEIDLIKENITSLREIRSNNFVYYTGTIGKYEVVLAKCGMGMVSAAAGTQALITGFSVDYVINTGCAGAVAKKLQIGDVVLSENVAEWNLDMLGLGKPFGYIYALDTVLVKADTKLINSIRPYVNGNVYEGLVVSADVFVRNKEQQNTILERFPEALCTEMEGAAVGHVCTQNGVPFCVVRCISDTADNDSAIDYPKFCITAGEKMADILVRMLLAADIK